MANVPITIRKKKCSDQYVGPYPIPINFSTGLQPAVHLWNYFKGNLNRNEKHVSVHATGDAKMLTSMGSFGMQMAQPDDSETLRLTLEEAFFLSFALGCLFIKDCDKEKIDIQDQWAIYCNLQPNFPVTYTGYHHFRSKNWVPKDGLKFGARFVLYKHGPLFYHSSYVAVIQTLDFKGKPILKHKLSTESIKDWTQLSGMSRLCSTVVKELMICSVLIPDNVNEIIHSPNCLKNFKIHENIVKRWVPSKDRERELDFSLL